MSTEEDFLHPPAVTDALAHKLIDAGEAKARELGIRATIVVADASGILKALLRMDGSTTASVEGAIGKCTTAALHQQPNDAWLTVEPGINVGVIGGERRMILFPGGKPIKVDGEFAGAIGVAGGHYQQDSEVAHAALAAVGYPADPTDPGFDGWRSGG